MNATGTFARVWLTRFRDPRRGNGVYALKTLRKADGQYGPLIVARFAERE